MSVEHLPSDLAFTEGSGPTLSVRLISCRSAPTVIEISGEVDMNTAHLITELVEHVARHSPTQVVLDMAKVRFFCAEGLRALLQARATVTAAGGQLFLRDPSRSTRRVLTITATDDLFPHHANAGPSR